MFLVVLFQTGSNVSSSGLFQTGSDVSSVLVSYFKLVPMFLLVGYFKLVPMFFLLWWVILRSMYRYACVLLLQHVAATLGSGNLKLAVQLPEGEDMNEWIAVNSESMGDCHACVAMTTQLYKIL